MNDQDRKQLVSIATQLDIAAGNLLGFITKMVNVPVAVAHAQEASKGRNPETAQAVNQAAPPPPKPQPKSGFVLGPKSLRELEGVNPVLVECVHRAIQLTEVDFRVYDGIRTKAEQERMVSRGVSKTMDSKHLTGHAVDLVPLIGGILKWDWEGCYAIACAMDQAATELGVAHRITWGAAWDKTLDQYGGEKIAYAKEVLAYANRHPGKDFLDGPHFQIK